jgi:hypothetical protein
MEEPDNDFRHNRPLQLMVGWLLIYWLVMAIAPFDRFDWLLENLLVFIYGALLASTYRRFAFSNLSYGLFTLFMTLHLTGAHYTYSETPATTSTVSPTSPTACSAPTPSTRYYAALPAQGAAGPPFSPSIW